MSFLHQKPARLLLAASALGLLVIVSAVFATKDLIPTGNALRASAAHSSGRISSSAFAFSDGLAQPLDSYSKDLIPTGNALRASAAHSSGRISSTEEVTIGLQHAPFGSTNLKWNATTRDLTVAIVMSDLAPDSTHPAHIHLGNCNSNGPIKYMLNDVKGDKVGDGSSTTTIHNVASGIPATGWCINIHNGPGLNTPDQFTPIACANIKNDNASVHHNQMVWVKLGPTNAANQSAHGNARLTLNHNTLTVVVTLDGLVPGSGHAAHIHAGSCKSQGGIVYTLNNVVADTHGHAQVTTVIQNVQSIPAHGWYVNVHYGTNISTQTGFDPIACGNVV